MDEELHPPISDGTPRRPTDGSIARDLDIAFAVSPDAPARARGEVNAWLAHGSSHDSLIDDALLLVSELVSNCVRHARITPDQLLHLTASRGEETLHLELHDAGTGGTVVRRTPQHHDAAGGFGFDLVAQLSSAWGVERDADGTTVWFELAVAATCYRPHRERRMTLTTRGAGPMPDHRDRSPSALAHGPAKPSDIERVRANVDEADTRATRTQEASVARHRQRISDRAAEREEDARS
jgi:anti-sigma regulatory factor (Ser/Thr protein kinase)